MSMLELLIEALNTRLGPGMREYLDYSDSDICNSEASTDAFVDYPPINDFPDDILMCIFCEIHEHEQRKRYRREKPIATIEVHQYDYLLVPLSHVNRRFRQLLLSNPTFWSVLRSDMDADLFHEFVLRSREAPLTIEAIYDGYGGRTRNTQVKDFMECVVPYAHRWKTFVFVVHHCRGGRPPHQLFLDLRKAYPSLDLPILRSLCLYFEPRGVISGDSKAFERGFSFFRSWNMPVLKTIIADSCTPRFDVAPPITSMEIRLSGHFIYPIESFAELLGRAENLQRLELYLDRTWLEEGAPRATKLLFPALETFVLVIESEGNPCIKDLQYLGRALDFPLVKTAALSIRTIFGSPATNYQCLAAIDCLLGPFKRARLLRDLSLHAFLNLPSGDPVENLESGLHMILEALPQVHVFRLFGQSIDPSDVGGGMSALSASEDRLDPLTIHFVECGRSLVPMNPVVTRLVRRIRLEDGNLWRSLKTVAMVDKITSSSDILDKKDIERRLDADGENAVFWPGNRETELSEVLRSVANMLSRRME